MPAPSTARAVPLVLHFLLGYSPCKSNEPRSLELASSRWRGSLVRRFLKSPPAANGRYSSLVAFLSPPPPPPSPRSSAGIRRCIKRVYTCILHIPRPRRDYSWGLLPSLQPRIHSRRSLGLHLPLYNIECFYGHPPRSLSAAGIDPTAEASLKDAIVPRRPSRNGWNKGALLLYYGALSYGNLARGGFPGARRNRFWLARSGDLPGVIRRAGGIKITPSSSCPPVITSLLSL